MSLLILGLFITVLLVVAAFSFFIEVYLPFSSTWGMPQIYLPRPRNFDRLETLSSFVVTVGKVSRQVFLD